MTGLFKLPFRTLGQSPKDSASSCRTFHLGARRRLLLRIRLGDRTRRLRRLHRRHHRAEDGGLPAQDRARDRLRRLRVPRILQVLPPHRILRDGNSRIAWNSSPGTQKNTSKDARWEEQPPRLLRRTNTMNKGPTASRSSAGKTARPTVTLQFILQVMAHHRGRAILQKFQPGQEMQKDRFWKGNTAIRHRRIGRSKRQSSCSQDNSSDPHNALRVPDHDQIGIAPRLPSTGKQDKSARTLRYFRYNLFFIFKNRSTTDMIRRGNERQPTASRTTFENSRTFRTLSGTLEAAQILKVKSLSTSCSFRDTQGARTPGQATSHPPLSSSAGSS